MMKDLKSDTKARIIVWGIICSMCVLMGVFGIVSFAKGNGKIGAIVYKTKPVIETFNSLSSLESYKLYDVEIKAINNKGNILLKYSSPTSSFQLDYIFEDMAGVPTLKATYGLTNEVASFGDLLTKELLNAIAVLNGYEEGQIKEKYGEDIKIFKNAKIVDGVNVTDTSNSRTVIINMSQSILAANVDTSHTIEEQENMKNDTLVTEDDALAMSSDFINGKAKLVKENIKVIYNKDVDKHIFYIQNPKVTTYTENIYNSINNVFKRLFPEEIYNKFVSTYPSLGKDYQDDFLTVTVDSQENINQEFETNDRIIKIVISPKSE